MAVGPNGNLHHASVLLRKEGRGIPFWLRRTANFEALTILLFSVWHGGHRCRVPRGSCGCHCYWPLPEFSVVSNGCIRLKYMQNLMVFHSHSAPPGMCLRCVTFHVRLYTNIVLSEHDDSMARFLDPCPCLRKGGGRDALEGAEPPPPPFQGGIVPDMPLWHSAWFRDTHNNTYFSPSTIRKGVMTVAQLSGMEGGCSHLPRTWEPVYVAGLELLRARPRPRPSTPDEAKPTFWLNWNNRAMLRFLMAQTPEPPRQKPEVWKAWHKLLLPPRQTVHTDRPVEKTVSRGKTGQLAAT